jgi:hypothetical protein
MWGVAIPGIVAFALGWLAAPAVTAALDGYAHDIGLMSIPLAGSWCVWEHASETWARIRPPSSPMVSSGSPARR